MITGQLELLAPTKPAPTGITHVLVPDMGTLCREDNLEARDRGDRIEISPHKDDRDRVEVFWPDGSWRYLKWSRIRWRNITCPWCRSLGHEFYRWTVRSMQARQA